MSELIKETKIYQATPAELHNALGLPVGWSVKGISAVNGNFEIRIQKD